MNLLNVLIFLCLIAGHTWLWVEFVNRTHSVPLPCGTLHRLRRVHDALMMTGPVAFTVYPGLTGPRILLDGTWADLSPLFTGLVLICSLGFLGLAWATARFHFRPRPAQFIESTSQVVDVAQLLGHRPIQSGKYERLAQLKWNEQFRVEFTEKVFEFRDLPAEFDGLTILHISDWHFFGTVGKEFFRKVSEHAAKTPVDLVCFSGDLIDNMDLIEWLPETLGQLKGQYGRYYILGNHDWYQQPDAVRAAMDDLGWTDVADRVVSVEIVGRTLEIAGDESPWMTKQRPRQVPAFSQNADFQLLLCHTPDRFLDPQVKADLILAGHTHGGQVQLPVFGPIYSPSRYGTRFASGVFGTNSKLMHVSRGLSGRHPFRYRCLPEVTFVKLTSSVGNGAGQSRTA